MGCQKGLLFAFVMIFLGSHVITEANAAEGKATYYNPPYVPSACYGYENNGVMIAAASNQIWDNRAACGRTYRVTCLGAAYDAPNPCRGSGTVTVRIVDYCPAGCGGNTMDLSREAFSSIADLDIGVLRISYEEV